MESRIVTEEMKTSRPSDTWRKVWKRVWGEYEKIVIEPLWEDMKDGEACVVNKSGKMLAADTGDSD